jgi:hypothetical protein
VKIITDDTEQMLYYGGEYLHLKYLPDKNGYDKFPDVIQKLTDIFILQQRRMLIFSNSTMSNKKLLMTLSQD